MLFKKREKPRNDIGEMVYQNAEDESYKRYKNVCYRYIVVKSLLFFLLGCLVSYIFR